MKDDDGMLARAVERLRTLQQARRGITDPRERDAADREIATLKAAIARYRKNRKS